MPVTEFSLRRQPNKYVTGIILWSKNYFLKIGIIFSWVSDQRKKMYFVVYARVL